ncbi:MAG TPA: TrmB family transcriptional regulator [Candidatus Diapherotrites archaeon]|uniref:TrmB family transcriptional regulator n=1 Tax=Candidatus Iainarchaeum sp. TaxID=3101447 RepID=A0A7J4J4Z5_9ARCH|nr:TrmB family transcriptional regulator [Candidatus Diapherotrites archaeon]
MADYTINSFLEKLGLTEYEAKTVSALFQLKEAQAPEISRTAQVPKTRVYDVLDRLTKKELVIEIHGRPKRYMAIEPEKVFNILIEEKKKELQSLEKEAQSLKDSVMLSASASRHERVMKVKERTDFMKILGQEIDSAQHSVVGITPIGKEHSIIRDSVKNASARNVEVRLISAINEGGDRIAREFTQAGVDVRGHDHGMNAYIIDGKKVVLAISNFAEEKPEYHFTIWPDNKPMADALMKYFDHIWPQAKGM